MTEPDTNRSNLIPKGLVGKQFFRPLKAFTNLNRMRKEASDYAIGGRAAIIHHHPADEDCDFSGDGQVHEYFSISQCKCENLGEGCDREGCEKGWKIHG